MKRSAVRLFVCFAAFFALILSGSTQVEAAKKAGAKAKTGGAAAAPAAAEGQPGEAQPGEAPVKEEPIEAEEIKPDVVPEGSVPAGGAKGPATLSWQDVVVVPRKAFLKSGRVELSPFTGLSVNDILIRHYSFGGEFNYFLSDVFWVGLQGQYFVKALSEREELLGLQYNRIPTLNRYLYGGAVNFGYVPAYGKFTLFNKSILHWETHISVGVGLTRTEIIPRNPGNQTFTTDALTASPGIGSRFFLWDWLTVNVTLRDYIFPDKFEPLNRPVGQSGADAKANATSAIVHNLMLYVGAGVYLPTGFQYKSPR